jgi:predicted nucleic acid-binding Zn ribbon protein
MRFGAGALRPDSRAERQTAADPERCRRTIFAMLLIVALAIVWSVLGNR